MVSTDQQRVLKPPTVSVAECVSPGSEVTGFRRYRSRAGADLITRVPRDVFIQLKQYIDNILVGRRNSRRDLENRFEKLDKLWLDTATNTI